MDKTELVDWLLENQALTLELINKSVEHLMTAPLYFRDEAYDQMYSKVRSELADEFSKTKGLHSQLMYDIINPEEFEAYIKQVMQNE